MTPIPYSLKWKGKSFRCWIVEEPEEWLPDCLDGWEVQGDKSQSPVKSLSVDEDDIGQGQENLNSQNNMEDHSESARDGEGNAAGVYEVLEVHEDGAGFEATTTVNREVRFPFPVINLEAFTAGNSEAGPNIHKHKTKRRPSLATDSPSGSRSNNFSGSISPRIRPKKRLRPDDPFGLEELLDLNQPCNVPPPSSTTPQVLTSPTDNFGGNTSDSQHGASSSGDRVVDEAATTSEVAAKLGIHLDKENHLLRSSILEEGEIVDYQ
ncbi:hypothetical protein Hanom_Chr04g00326391 [Helianthus anomalus]